MSLGSTAAKNIALRACYGDSRSSLWPATVYLRLYLGDPADSGVEISGGGYAAVAVANTDANMNVPTTGLLEPDVFTFPTSTGAWSAVPDHWAFTDGSGTVLDTGVVSDNPGVTTASVDALIALAIDPG